MICDVVFEGGGAKGIALVGAWEVFLDQGLQPGRLLGTSAGAIMAVFIAAGYTTDEMFQALTEEVNGQPVMARFLATPEGFSEAEVRNSTAMAWMGRIPLLPGGIGASLIRLSLRQPLFRHVFSFVERGGWYSAHNFERWLDEKLDQGRLPSGQSARFSQMTLQEFFEATGFELTLIASDTTYQRMLILNHTTAPDCPLVAAVRMSMSIPLLWEEVIWQAAWRNYRNTVTAGAAIVDGGLLSNFPIEPFLSNLASVTSVMGPKQERPVVGFLIDEDLAVDDYLAGGRRGLSLARLSEFKPVQRISRLANTATTARDRLVIDAYAEKIARLPAAGYGTTEFDMSEQRRSDLVEAGTEAMRRYLAAHPPDAAPRAAALPAESAVYDDLVDRMAARILDES
jgi:NTE family protein